MNAGQSVDWVPALAVLAVGLVAGTLAILRLFTVSRRSARAGPGVALQVRDLAGKRDALLRQLRELEDTGSKRTAEQLARERYALELETARVLLALDERGASEGARRAPKRAAAKSGRSGPARPDRAGLRGFLWGTGTATALVLLGLFVYQSAKPRDPGGSVTGEVPMGGRTAAGGATDAEEARIQAALARNPQNLDARLALIRSYADRQDWMGVWNETGRVLQQSPGHPEALSYQAIVRLAMGQTDVAVNMLAKAIAADPDLVVAYAYLVIGQSRMGRIQDAEATVTRASKRFPERVADFQQLLEEQKREGAVAQTSVAPGQSDPHQGLATPGEGAGGAPAPARSGGRRVAGTVDLEPSLKNAVAPGGILFVFARAAGAAGGPPVAVKRLPATFPAAFELTEADSMMGQPLPDRLLIEARLDSDGDPTTRSPADPKARLDGVKAGRTDLHLVLRR